MKKHYQKYCMHFAYAIISTSTFLFTTTTFGQEKFEITPEITKHIIETYDLQEVKIFPVTYKEIEYQDNGKTLKRFTYMMDEKSINVSSLTGSFTEISNNYMIAFEDIQYDDNTKNDLIKNELSNTDYSSVSGMSERSYLIKEIGSEALYFVMPYQFLAQIKLEAEQKKFQNMGNNVEYKNWKTKYLNLLRSAQTNVNSCNAIIKKHTFVNAFGQRRYDQSAFPKQDKITFNKNLDSLDSKIKQLTELERDGNFYSYYSSKVPNGEAVELYKLSTYYNTTTRCY